MIFSYIVTCSFDIYFNDVCVYNALLDRIWYKNEYGTNVPYSVEYGTFVPYSDRIWYNFRPNMVQTLYHIRLE